MNTFQKLIHVKGLLNLERTDFSIILKKNRHFLLLPFSKEASNANTKLLKFLWKFYTETRNNTRAKRDTD